MDSTHRRTIPLSSHLLTYFSGLMEPLKQHYTICLSQYILIQLYLVPVPTVIDTTSLF